MVTLPPQASALPPGTIIRTQGAPGQPATLTAVPAGATAGAGTPTTIRTITPSGAQLVVPVSQLQQTIASAQANKQTVVVSQQQAIAAAVAASQGVATMVSQPITVNASVGGQPTVVSGGSLPTNTPLTVQTSSANSQAASSAPSQMSPSTAKKKCKNFLSTLIRLASDQPDQVANNVKTLIQGLIVRIVVVMSPQNAPQYTPPIAHMHTIAVT